MQGTGHGFHAQVWIIFLAILAAFWTPFAVTGIKDAIGGMEISSGYRRGGQRSVLMKQELSGTNSSQELAFTEKYSFASEVQNVSVVNRQSAPKRLVTKSVAFKEDKWIVPILDVQSEKGRLVPVLEFQRDHIMSADTFALYNATWSNLQSFSLSFWANVYDWRFYSQLVSYALDLDRDNAILISQSWMGLEYWEGEVRLIFPWEDDIAYILEWIHVCIVVSRTKHILYIDGKEVLQQKRIYSNWNAGDPQVVLEKGGILVLGQDQDKPGGGFERKHSLCGSIADFHLFETLLTAKEIRALHHFQPLAQKSLLDLRDPNWLFRNVLLSEMKIESLYATQVTGKFFLFFEEVASSEVLKLCNDLGGDLPSSENIKQMLITLNEYFLYSGRDFIKISVFYQQSTSAAKTVRSLKVIWEAQKYIEAMPSIDINSNPFICCIKKQRYIRLLGVPEDMEYIVDKWYKLHMYQGSNQLQGKHKTYIYYSNNKWSLQSKELNKSEVLMYLHSASDYLPLGRRLWILSPKNESVKLLLTSCNSHQFTCDSGDCISLNLRCNTYVDCLDGSDEENCLCVPSTGSTGPPLKSLSISGSILFNNIPEVNLNKNFFSATMWMNISWTDERLYLLNLRNKTETVLKAYLFHSNMWSPELVLKPLQNDISTFLTTGTAKRLCDGKQRVFDAVEEMMFTMECFEIWRKELIYVMWQCEFNLKKFPFESVPCRLSVELDDDQLWHRVNVSLPMFSHLPYEVSLVFYYIKGSTVVIKLLFLRKYGGYVVTTFIPIMILNAISIFTFLFEPQDFTNRIMVTVSLLIVVASLSAQTASSLPNTSYTKCIDLVFLSTIFFLSTVFVSHVICSIIWRRRKIDDFQAFGMYGNKVPRKDTYPRLNIVAAIFCLFTATACVLVCIDYCI
ncbi:uncharacterized protein [Palaemon carinicauda]|uniref:uncharacterized protein n=1 Tax=Palaemon carinicauda TaxID=392227 RepID=UPI0035B5A5BA